MSCCGAAIHFLFKAGAGVAATGPRHWLGAERDAREVSAPMTPHVGRHCPGPRWTVPRWTLSTGRRRACGVRFTKMPLGFAKKLRGRGAGEPPGHMLARATARHVEEV